LAAGQLNVTSEIGKIEKWREFEQIKTAFQQQKQDRQTMNYN